MIRLDNAENAPHNVVSNQIFGPDKHTNELNARDKKFEDKYTKLGYIDLTRKVLNPFLAGRSASVWRIVLGLDDKKITNIIDANIIWDNEKDDFVHISEVGQKSFDIERYVFGADLLVKLLDEVDVQAQLNHVLITTYLFPLLTKDEKDDYAANHDYLGEVEAVDPTDMIDGTVSIVDGGWLFGNYFINFEKGYLSPERIDELLAGLMDQAENIDVTEMKQFPIVSLLASMAQGDGKDALKAQILDYVFVLPKGYRPTIDGRVDAITSQYNKLVNANLELHDILDQQNPTCYAVLNKYREVVQYIRNIFIGDDGVISRQRLRDYKSISDSITGKEGLMRGRMQGVRVDYSGRAVITSDPEMPIDTIGVPRSMLYKIVEPNVIRDAKKGNSPISNKLRHRNLSRLSTTTRGSVDGCDYNKLLDAWFEQCDRYGVIGRQPTLFMLGIQGFKIKPVDGDSIILSPLVVMPFNADFDGDQMHLNVPVTPAAIDEVKKLMASSTNIRYPKNGEITIVTRHEIIYGLWLCSTTQARDNSRFVSKTELANMSDAPNATGVYKNAYDAVIKQKIAIYDMVETPSGKQTAGMAALSYAIFHSIPTVDLEAELDGKGIKAKKITALLQEAYGSNTSAFLNAINRLVKLGFAVAKIWPPNISTIIGTEIREHIDNLISEFNMDIVKREEYVNIGIEIDSEYSNYFNKKWDKLNKEVSDYLLKHLGTDNGYISMMKSGGKGDKNNIMQIFGLKGRVQKNDTTAFNSIVSGSYSGQLTGLESFISAYGSRQGISDKVLATAEPGYLSRRLEHAGSIISVFDNDCGTTDGIEFTLEDVVPFIDDSQISRYGVRPPRDANDAREFVNTTEYKTQLIAAKSYLAKMLIGRYVVNDNGESIYVENENAAYHVIDSSWGYVEPNTHNYVPTGKGVVKMRSPIYCKRPCCKKCYGADIFAGTKEPELGRAIGFIAAQAIGEPGTQMTMKNFQKGGVVTEANLTSSFQLIDDYFELHDFSKKKNRHGVISYDMISPVDATIVEQYLGNGTKRIILKPDHPEDPIVKSRMRSLANRKIIVYSQTKLKEHVYEGESFQRIQGNLNMKEVLKYRGYDKAALYLTMILYNIFRTQDINSKHFETIVASMSMCYLLTNADNVYDYNSSHSGEKTHYKAGSLITWPEACYDLVGQSCYVRTILGLKKLPKFKNDFFESLLMESMDSYIPRAILMNPNDSMTNPITRAAFGLHIGIGSDIQK